MIELFILSLLCIMLPLLVGVYSLINWDKLDDKIEWLEQFKKK